MRSFTGGHAAPNRKPNAYGSSLAKNAHHAGNSAAWQGLREMKSRRGKDRRRRMGVQLRTEPRHVREEQGGNGRYTSTVTWA
jgi:hypothetical protein